MDKVKKVLHIRSKSKNHLTVVGHGEGGEQDTRPSIDPDVESMDPEERDRYLKEIEEAEKHDTVKKGGWLDKLIAQGNKRTEDELAAEQAARDKKDGVIR